MVLVLGILLVALIIFQTGLLVGSNQAGFACKWNRAFIDNPGGPDSVLRPFLGRHGGPNPNGAIGEIISTNFPSILIKNPEGLETIATVDSETAIRSGRQTASTSDLEIGKKVIIVGQPDEDGRIKAALIRILPEQPNSIYMRFSPQTNSTK